MKLPGKPVKQIDIARACNVNQTAVSKILAGKTEGFHKKTVEKILKKARELGYVHPLFYSTNRRISERIKVCYNAKIKFITDGRIYNQGTCQLLEMSLSGALIGNLNTTPLTMPLKTMRIVLEIMDGPLAKSTLQASIVRFPETPFEFTIAVKFAELSSEVQRKLKKLIPERIQTRRPSQADVARAANIDPSTVSRILAGCPYASYKDETIRKVLGAARKLGYLHYGIVKADLLQQRMRKRVSCNAKIKIVIGVNTFYDRGTCRIYEISPSEIILINLATSKQSLPFDRPRIDVDILDGELAGSNIKSDIAGFLEIEKNLAIVAEILDMSRETRQKILKLVK